MLPLYAGQIALGIYALLLAVGGIIGYTKAGSRPSLIAGILSALVAFMALLLTTYDPRLGTGVGALAALVLAVFFGYRFLAKTRKFMPAGMLAVVSLVILVVAILVLM